MDDVPRTCVDSMETQLPVLASQYRDYFASECAPCKNSDMMQGHTRLAFCVCFSLAGGQSSVFASQNTKGAVAAILRPRGFSFPILEDFNSLLHIKTGHPYDGLQQVLTVIAFTPLPSVRQGRICSSSTSFLLLLFSFPLSDM